MSMEGVRRYRRYDMPLADEKGLLDQLVSGQLELPRDVFYALVHFTPSPGDAAEVWEGATDDQRVWLERWRDAQENQRQLDRVNEAWTEAERQPEGGKFRGRGGMGG